MYTQGYIPALTVKNPNMGSTGTVTPASAVDSKQYPKFKDMLSDVSGKYRYASKSPNSADRSGSQSLGTKSSEKGNVTFRNFKEASNSSIHNTKAADKDTAAVSADHAVKAEEASNGKSKGNSVSEQAQSVICALSQILGIKSEDLCKMLEMAGIKPEDISDSSKASDIASKLSSLIGLDDEQKAVLTQLLEAAAGNSGKETKLQNPNNSEPDGQAGHSAVIMPDADTKVTTEVIIQKAVDIPLSEMTQKLKQKLQEFAESCKDTTVQATGEGADINSATADSIKTAVKTDEAEVRQSGTSEVKKQDNVKEITPASRAESTETGKKQDSKQRGGNEGQKLENVQSITAAEVKKAKVQERFNNTKPDEAGTVTIVGSTQAGPAKSTNPAGNIKFNANTAPSKNEILNQVIEKSKIVLSGEKSEMVMDLKPDSLGKLSLKVVTERGMVVAKFVAESQQVKEALEANMQVLRDSLEKQGLSVQGFSVSVQQDSTRNSDERYTAGSSRLGRAVNNAREPAVAVDRIIDLPRNNPYSWNESSINLTA